MACCDICGAVFTLQINLKRDISVQHKESDPIKLSNHRGNKRKCSLQ